MPMAMLPLSVEDLARLAGRGGGFEIDAARVTHADIVRIVSHVVSNARIVITNAQRIPIDDLVSIAAHGKGAVIFEASFADAAQRRL